MSDADKTVLIIGGGPAGLTLANALQVKGVACKVFERNNKTFGKTVGAGFCLSHGRLWLESISEEIKKGTSEITTPIPGLKVVERAEGEESAIGVYDMSKSPKVEKGLRGPFLAGCTRSSLMNMLHSKLKPGTVVLGWECKDINENENGTMTVQFDVEEVDEAGKKSKKSVSETGAVVVGADGMHSKVRQLMFGPKMLQVYDQGGWLLLQRDIPKSVVDFTKRENQFVRLVAPNIGDDIACVGYAASPGDFELCMSYKLSKGGNGHSWKNDRYASSLRKKEVLETMKKMPGFLGKIASLAESPEDLVHISLSDSSASLDLKEWHLGRVVIIGDAPHGPTPLLGEGCNTAIGDACVLAKYLAKAFQNIGEDKERTDEFITHAFEGYESERKEFGESICRAGNKMFSNPIFNLVLPQIAIPPRNSFQVLLRKILSKLFGWLLRTFSEILAGEVIHEVTRGCEGAFDTDEGDLQGKETLQRRSSRRESVQKSVTGFRMSSRSGV